jgi:hypothetical protein
MKVVLGLLFLSFAVPSSAQAGPLKGMAKKFGVPALAAGGGNSCAELQKCWEESIADPKLAQFHDLLKGQNGQIQHTVGRGNPAECIQVGTMLGQAFVGVGEEMAGQKAQMEQMMGFKPGDMAKLQQESMAMAKAAIPKTAEEREAALAAMPPTVREMTRRSWAKMLSGETEQQLAEAQANDAVQNSLTAKWPESCPWSK